MSRAQAFLHLFNRLDAYLLEVTGVEDRNKTFNDVLEQAARRNRAVRNHESEIKSFKELRNVIVHETRFGPEPIAEPNEKALKRFESLVQRILNPPRADSLGSEPHRVFDLDDRLSVALTHMRELDFSQVVVYSEECGHSLLTSEGITRWIEHSMDEGILDLAGVPIGEVMQYEPEGIFRTLRRDATIYDVREAFDDALNRSGVRLFAVLVTQNGRRTDSVLRIITPWDLLSNNATRSGGGVA